VPGRRTRRVAQHPKMRICSRHCISGRRRHPVLSQLGLDPYLEHEFVSETNDVDDLEEV